MRSRIVPRAVALLVALIASAGAVAAKDKKTDKPAEPFFHQFLIPGDPLDENLLLQEKRVAESPENAAMRNDFGNLLAERRFPKEARAEYKKALELDKHFFLAAYNLGMMEETIGRTSAAAAAYREAIHRRPGFPPAHFRLGRLYERAGRPSDAIAEYAIALRIDNSMRDPKRNPLSVDSRLLDQASLVNYPEDLARVAQSQEADYVDKERFRPVPIERPLDSEEVTLEDAGPQTIESHPSSPVPPRSGGRAGTATGPRADRRSSSSAAPPPPRPGRNMRAAEPVPTAVPAQAVPPPVITPEPEPEPTPEPQTR